MVNCKEFTLYTILLFENATDRIPVPTTEIIGRIDIGLAEAQTVHTRSTVPRRRPVLAVATLTRGCAIAEAASESKGGATA